MYRRPRPPWWPEEEPWPPVHGPWSREGRRSFVRGSGWYGYRRGGVARRFGCFIVALSALVVSVGVLVLWLLASLFGGRADGLLAQLARPAGIIVLIAGIIALVVGVRIARGVAPPIADLVAAAGRVEAGDLSVRVAEPRSSPGEMRTLTRAFNEMTARLQAEDANRRRLLADVGHELRTPLAVIQGNLEALLDGVYPADEAHLAPILEETRVMARLIDDLRTVSLAESGVLPLHREATDIPAMLEDVAAAHRPAAQAKGAVINVIRDATGPIPPAEVDPVRIRQVVSNLVDNALRHVPEGGFVNISVNASPQGPKPDTISIAVSDNGPGIPEELRDTVFDRFTKAETSRGSGLGLAIARAIVQAHGGKITLADEVPPDRRRAPEMRGTRIHLTLPVRPPANPEPASRV